MMMNLMLAVISGLAVNAERRSRTKRNITIRKCQPVGWVGVEELDSYIEYRANMLCSR